MSKTRWDRSTTGRQADEVRQRMGVYDSPRETAGLSLMPLIASSGRLAVKQHQKVLKKISALFILVPVCLTECLADRQKKLTRLGRCAFSIEGQEQCRRGPSEYLSGLSNRSFKIHASAFFFIYAPFSSIESPLAPCPLSALFSHLTGSFSAPRSLRLAIFAISRLGSGRNTRSYRSWFLSSHGHANAEVVRGNLGTQDG